ncbi:MAG: hypothetical protein K5790_01635 [Nitrosopumilus sp.]|uniref:hypothetical protein n=1 Tax=Nitrosopumilus sp. TaxID=2024843 RepID=UPI00247D1989|nr:hypothetical protein [Nitrosopumilus sp.]MCV0391975.1 hypothetical protein [Nitrosopumilus sp.]
MRPRITNALKGALGEVYYKELCDQRGWAYCSLENLHNSTLDVVSFKKGFSRIRVKIPDSIKSEVRAISTPSNGSVENPSFVFDYLACKVGDATSGVQRPSEFCWSEVKTGLGIFSKNQHNTMYKIALPIAVFVIEDIFEKPHHIEMDWKIKSGKEIADSLHIQYSSKTSYHTKTYQKNTYQKKTHRYPSYGKTNTRFSSKSNRWIS